MAERVDVTIDKVVAGGDGLGHLDDGRVIFVGGALPGETVTAEIVQTRRDFVRARLLDVIDAHHGRRAAPCPLVAAGCGGCSWQHIDADVQRQLKVGIVTEALTRTGRLVDPVVAIGSSLPTTGFRTSLRLAVLPGGAPALRAARSHDVVRVERCLVAHPLLDDLLATARFPRADEVSVRCSPVTGERSVLVSPARAERAAIIPADVQRGPGASITEVVGEVRLIVSATSFFQSRHDGAEALVRAVRVAAEGSEPDALVVDAYGGVGVFAATVHRTAPVVAIETSPSSSSDAVKNLRDRAATVVNAAVEDWTPVPAGLVIADPARAGLGRAAVAVLAACRAPVFVLVSCDAVSLARDAALLRQCGYEHVRSDLVDLFPHTPHVEVVTRFEWVG